MTLDRRRVARPVVTAFIALLLAACAAAQPSPTDRSATPRPSSAPVTTPGPDTGAAPSFGPRPTPIPDVEACRRAILAGAGSSFIGRRLTDDERRNVHVALEVTVPGAYQALFTDGAHDMDCRVIVTYGHRQVETSIWPGHADALGPDRALVVGPVGGTSELQLGIAWGSVRSDVARVTMTDAAGTSADATIANGYFLAWITGGPCCVFSLAAFDASGRELGRGP